jgi:hypothetical protein
MSVTQVATSTISMDVGDASRTGEAMPVMWESVFVLCCTNMVCACLLGRK